MSARVEGERITRVVLRANDEDRAGAETLRGLLFRWPDRRLRARAPRRALKASAEAKRWSIETLGRRLAEDGL
jgi:hypothetical protein